ncbi:putative quinol monooxygenase [Oceanospirillum sp.]|uniref:putative quinol monooxygenase n=1 Tax=Oceanospirillum sp. TaxID=2021254 RepID=UPI003A906F62
MLYLLAHLQVTSGHKHQVLESLDRLRTETLKEPGCIQYELLQDLPIELEGRNALSDNLILISEIWRSETDLHRHLEKEYMHVFQEQATEWITEIRLNTLSRACITPIA